jgi:hypothetical protein
MPRSAVPNEKRGALPPETTGLASLFSGWNQGLDRLAKNPVTPSASPSKTTITDFPEMLLKEIPTDSTTRRRESPSGVKAAPEKEVLPPLALNWVEPAIPRIPWRVKLRIAWRRLLDLSHYRPERDQDWEG